MNKIEAIKAVRALSVVRMLERTMTPPVLSDPYHLSLVEAKMLIENLNAAGIYLVTDKDLVRLIESTQKR